MCEPTSRCSNRTLSNVSSARSHAIDRLYQTVSTTFGVSPGELREDTSPETVEAWDSLNHLTLVMALETEFGIELTADDVLEMRDLRTIRDVLRRRGADL